MGTTILFLTQSNERLPSVRFRVLPLVELGRRRGIAVSYSSIPKSIFQRLHFFWKMPHYDIVVIQKKLFSFAELCLLRRRCGKLGFDFDDAIWNHHPSEPETAGRARKDRKNARRFRQTLPLMDVVIAGNRNLADEALKFRSDVSIVPTPLDTDIYVPGAPHPTDVRPQVGWIGTSSNLFFLPEVFQALAPCANSVRYRVVSDKQYPHNGGTEISFAFWSPERELELLQEMDIGLMPLTDDDYTRGKCGFKILQYMACGVVPIASAVGFNREIIEHGRDGFLVERPEEWAEYVLRLAADPALRASMAAAAREKVVREFSLQALSERYWKALGV